ncbi:MAG: ECF transporter S component [Firmicutes bacterium]|nr:ECF transporter S component [Bacillota bacterium]
MKKAFLTISLCLCFAAALLLMLWGARSFYVPSLLMMGGGFLLLALQNERREQRAAEMVICALFCALAVVGRAAFFYTPFIKAITAMIVLAGVFTGAKNGFLIGACAGLVSNFVFGQGPWTPWQMLCWGLIGLLAGKLFFGKKPATWQVCLFGGAAVFGIFALIMNPASLLMIQAISSADSLLAAYIVALPMDITHCISTIIFLALLYQPLQKKMQRLEQKYGIFMSKEK